MHRVMSWRVKILLWKLICNYQKLKQYLKLTQQFNKGHEQDKPLNPSTCLL